jgi:hypothetical protein
MSPPLEINCSYFTQSKLPVQEDFPEHSISADERYVKQENFARLRSDYEALIVTKR